MIDLTNKTAFITGASRRIGRALFLARASELLEDLEKLQVALAVEKRKARGFKLKRK